jgi:hypothetical protein
VPGGAGFVDFDSERSDGGRYRADVTDISVSGMTFELEAGPKFEKGAILVNANLHISDCVVEGELLVKHWALIRKSRVEVGCLFYPSSQIDEEKLSAVLAGLQAATRA